MVCVSVVNSVDLWSVDEFVQAVQSSAGMALVALIRTVMGNGDKVASVVGQSIHREGMDEWMNGYCHVVQSCHVTL